MSHLPEHLAHFRTLASLRPPRVTVAIAWIVTVGIAATIFICCSIMVCERFLKNDTSKDTKTVMI